MTRLVPDKYHGAPIAAPHPISPGQIPCPRGDLNPHALIGH